MDNQVWRLFELEDGSALSFAIHEDVPQHDRLREAITANHGAITEDPSSADFVIVSNSLPGIESIAGVLRNEGKLPIQDWWIRNSVEAGRLMPWYPYVIGNGSTEESMSDSDRNLHELVVAAARYWPILTGEKLYQFVVRKCPHLSIAECRALHSANQATFDASVADARRRIRNGLAPGGSLIMQPKLSFGSPHRSVGEKRTSLVIVPPKPTAQTQNPAQAQHQRAASSPIMPFAPTPTSIPRELIGGSTRAGSIRTEQRSEGPEPGPNLEPPLTDRSELSPIESDTEYAPKHPSKSKEKQGFGTPVSKKDREAMVRFLVEKPRSGYASWEEYWAAFQRQWNGSHRSSAAWHTMYKRSEEDIQKSVETLRRQRRTQAEAKKSAEQQGTGTSDSITQKKPETVPSKFTEEDLDALALYLVDHPRGNTAQMKYYADFQAQYAGSTRSVGAWMRGVRKHELTIVAKMNAILDERQNLRAKLKAILDEKRNAISDDRQEQPQLQ